MKNCKNPNENAHGNKQRCYVCMKNGSVGKANENPSTNRWIWHAWSWKQAEFVNDKSNKCCAQLDLELSLDSHRMDWIPSVTSLTKKIPSWRHSVTPGVFIAGKPIQCHNFVLRHVVLHFRLLSRRSLGNEPSRALPSLPLRTWLGKTMVKPGLKQEMKTHLQQMDMSSFPIDRWEPSTIQQGLSPTPPRAPATEERCAIALVAMGR